MLCYFQMVYLLTGFKMLSGTESICKRLSSNAISTRCSNVSLSPRMPPEQTRIPAFEHYR